MRFIKWLIDNAPEIGGTAGAAAGLIGGAAAELYAGDSPGRAPYGLMTAMTTILGAAIGGGAGDAIRGMYEHPQAARAALGAGAITALLTYGLSQNLPDPLPAIFVAEYGGLGTAAGYMLGRIREDRNLVRNNRNE